MNTKSVRMPVAAGCALAMVVFAGGASSAWEQVGPSGPFVTRSATQRSGAAKVVVTDLTTVERSGGSWYTRENVAAGYRTFAKAGSLICFYEDSEVAFGVKGSDWLEMWVGLDRDQTRGAAEIAVTVRGDGRVLRTVTLRRDDVAEYVCLSLKGVSSLTLQAAQADGIVVFGEPKLYKGGKPKAPEGASGAPTGGGVSGTGSGEQAPAGEKILRLDPEKIKSLAEQIHAKLGRDEDSARTTPTVAIAAFRLIPRDVLAPANAENVREDLSTALIDTGSMDVVERAQLDKALQELKIGLSDTFDSATVQKLGKLVNARMVLIGSISDRDTYVVINVRLLDTETGRARIAASTEIRQ